MQKTFPELYKRDSKGKVRVWFMEQDGDKYRTFDGLQDGTVKASAWRTAKPTNVGRSNERQGVAQATFEIEASYTKQLKGAYYEDVADIDLGCRYTEPMLAETYKKFEPGAAQPKFDGIRCIIKRDGCFSREGEVLPGGAHIRTALEPLFEKMPTIELDGELYNHDLRDDFNKLSSLIKKGGGSPELRAKIEMTVEYHCYDIASALNADFIMRNLALLKIAELFPCPMFKIVETVLVDTQEQYDELHIKWVGEGYEGSMWRSKTGGYQQGARPKALQKRKDFDDAEFDLILDGIEEGEGNWAGAAKRAVFWLPNADRSVDLSNKKAREANTFETGIRGTYDFNKKLLENASEQKVATVRFFGWTPSDVPKPRFGVVTAWHGAGRTL